MNDRSDRNEPLIVDGETLSISDVTSAVQECPDVQIADEARERIRKAREIVVKYVKKGEKVYGVTTGVGSQKNQSLKPEDITSFNQSLVTGHATVVSDRILSEDVVRASLIAQINKFACGKSGVRLKLVEALVELFCSDQVPRANVESSVGAGDLVPLAQISLSLLGIPNPLMEESRNPGSYINDLASKEALSLINSNSVSIGHGTLLLEEAYQILCGFDLSTCMSLEGFRGNMEILERGVERANPEKGHVTALNHMRELLSESGLRDVGEARNIQDPLSFRCAPQVNGATHDAMADIRGKWTHALNSVEDNPVVDLENEKLLHHGNMDCTSLTLGLDQLRSALAKVVEISTRRLDKMHWPAFSDLPSGLLDEPGPVGGVQFLNLSHISESHAAIVRQMAEPALLNYQGQLADGVEDHAALLPHSVRKLERLLESARVIQAIELVVSTWAIHRRDIPVDNLGNAVGYAYELICPYLPLDKKYKTVFDLRPVVDLIRQGELTRCYRNVDQGMIDYEADS